VISVSELDPLRDEAVAYHRKLINAGVGAVSRTVNGPTHAGDFMFPGAMPDVWDATIPGSVACREGPNLTSDRGGPASVRSLR
jgi:acetyl esterase/lipase